MYEQTSDMFDDCITIEHIRPEVIRLLTETPEVELAAIYRAAVTLLGAHAVPTVGETLARMIRDGTIAIHSRRNDPAGPVLGYVRFVDGGLR